MKHIFLLLIISGAHSLTRRLTMEKSPGCSNCSVPVYYTTAEGPKDTLHYIWDFTNKPTVFVALTYSNVKTAFNWTDSADGIESFNFTSVPIYMFALVFNKLIQYDDINDTGVLTSSTRNVSYDTGKFLWQPLEDLNTTLDSEIVTINMKGFNYSDSNLSLNGTLSLKLSAFGIKGRDSIQPRLLHSPNSTQCTVILENVQSNVEFNSSRYAVEFILASSDSKNSSSKIDTKMNFDDENSPGVFSIINLMTPNSQDHLYEGVFLQWRPVAFTDKKPSLINSTEVLSYNLTNLIDSDEKLKETLIYKYQGSDFSNNLMQQTIVSIGLSEDGFYKKTNYSSWTFTVNYGSPENEKFSLLVIMVMAIGLGLPIILIFLGGSYKLSSRLRKTHEMSLTR